MRKKIISVFVLCVLFNFLFPGMYAHAGVTDWIEEAAQNSINKWLSSIFTDFATDAFSFIEDFLITETDMSKVYDKAPEVLLYVQGVAQSLIGVFAIRDILGIVMDTITEENDRSLESVIKGAVIASCAVWIMPFFLTDVLIQLGNLSLGFVAHLGVGIDVMKMMLHGGSFVGGIVIMALLFSIAALILGVMSYIRNIQLLVLFLITPLVATSLVKGYDGSVNWLRESVALIFTQTLQVFLLNVMLNSLGTNVSVEAYLKAIGVIAVMLTGPAFLKQFIYSTGMAGTSAKGVIALSRMIIRSIGK
ncbi:conjugal transfer protein TrbL family protein [Streptomyces avermitilis]